MTSNPQRFSLIRKFGSRGPIEASCGQIQPHLGHCRKAGSGLSCSLSLFSPTTHLDQGWTVPYPYRPGLGLRCSALPPPLASRLGCSLPLVHPDCSCAAPIAPNASGSGLGCSPFPAPAPGLCHPPMHPDWDQGTSYPHGQLDWDQAALPTTAGLGPGCASSICWIEPNGQITDGPGTTHPGLTDFCFMLIF